MDLKSEYPRAKLGSAIYHLGHLRVEYTIQKLPKDIDVVGDNDEQGEVGEEDRVGKVPTLGKARMSAWTKGG